MQKLLFFWQKVILFIPAAIFLSSFNYWAPVAVGLLNPVEALKQLKNVVIYEEETSAPNPFRDFSIENFRQTAAATGTDSEKTNTDYNVIKEAFSSAESNIILKKDACYVKNLTHMPAEEVKKLMLSPVEFTVEKNSSKPQILIMHTHATESYLPSYGTEFDPSYAFRSTDNNKNMVAVGKVMADILNSKGYNTIQDSTQHDYPSYNGSYDKSRDTVESYLEKYPSIKIVLDVHRDAVERDGAIIAPTATINGAEYAQIMIISGRDNGYMNMPNYRQNLKFAAIVQNRLSKDRPGITRPILFDYRNYNQQLTTGSLLVEIGTHGSTLSRAKRSREQFALSLAAVLEDM